MEHRAGYNRPDGPSGQLRCGERREAADRAELSSEGDPELGEDAVQVRADRPVGQVQPLRDVPVREPLGGELGDLQLLGGQLVAGCRSRAGGWSPRRPGAPGGPGRPRPRSPWCRRRPGPRAAARASRRSGAGAAATGRRPATAGPAEPASTPGRRPAPRRSDPRLPTGPARAAPARAAARSRYRFRGRHRTPLRPVSTRARASAIRSVYRAASARSPMSQHAITGWWAGLAGSKRRSAAW